MNFSRKRLCLAALVLGVLALAVVFCAVFFTPPRTPLTGQHSHGLRVAVSFTIPADWVREVGGAHVVIETLAPPNSNPHAFQPTIADVHRLRRADLVVGISPVLEPWFAALIKNGEFAGKTLWLADTPTDEPEPPALENEPHLWMDPLRVVPLIRAIASRLAAGDTANATFYITNAERYIVAIRALAGDARHALEDIPDERRVLFSAHDNLRRLAHATGLRTGGAIIASTDSESADPSAAALATLVHRARAAGVPIFLDNTGSDALARAVSRDASLPSPVRLYTDSLSAAGGPAGTYLTLYRENIRRISAALKKPEP